MRPDRAWQRDGERRAAPSGIARDVPLQARNARDILGAEVQKPRDDEDASPPGPGITDTTGSATEFVALTGRSPKAAWLATKAGMSRRSDLHCLHRRPAPSVRGTHSLNGHDMVRNTIPVTIIRKTTQSIVRPYLRVVEMSFGKRLDPSFSYLGRS